jgi:dolichyl-diphosphooligosaccharide--protein glycosyltransferase
MSRKYLVADNDSLRFYPDKASYKSPVPMISVLLSMFSTFTNGNYYFAGIYLIPFLAGLFILPFSIYFYRLKLPIAGIFGGLIGTFAFIYYVRSCTGRVDTDALNLFFPILSSLFILLLSESDSVIKKYIYSALSGLSMALFYWWYAHPGFTLIYFVVLFFVLFLNDRKNIKINFLILAVFILFSNPLWFYNGIFNLIGAFGNYFTLNDTRGVGFPNILKTITEAKKQSFASVLEMMLGVYSLTILGLLGFIGLILYKFKKIVPILPVFLLGLLAFKSSNRFAMFLAPFVGVGIGFLIHFILDFLFKNIKLNNYLKILSPYLIMIILFFSISKYTAYSFVPRPSIESGIFKSFIELKKELPENSAIYSWWDYGYAMEDVMGVPVFHDGGSQGSPKTYFIARSLISDSQAELYKIANYFDENGMKKIKEILEDNKSAQDVLEEVLSYDANGSKDNIPVIYFSRDMISKYGSFSYIGSWDFEKNKSKPENYMQLRCESLKNNILKCSKNILDLNTGLIDNKIPLKKFIIVNKGKVVQEKDYPYSNGYYLQILIDNNKLLSTLLLKEDIFNSNFNQMFLLGRYDKDYFEEIYNGFPFARAYKIIK